MTDRPEYPYLEGLRPHVGSALEPLEDEQANRLAKYFIQRVWNAFSPTSVPLVRSVAGKTVDQETIEEVLEGFPDELLQKRWGIYLEVEEYEEEELFELEQDEVDRARESGFLPHPYSGHKVRDWEDRLTRVYRPTNQMADLAARLRREVEPILVTVYRVVESAQVLVKTDDQMEAMDRAKKMAEEGELQFGDPDVELLPVVGR